MNHVKITILLMGFCISAMPVGSLYAAGLFGYPVPKIASAVPDPSTPIIMNPGETQQFEVILNNVEKYELKQGWQIIDADYWNTCKLEEGRNVSVDSTDGPLGSAGYSPDMESPGKYVLRYKCTYSIIDPLSPLYAYLYALFVTSGESPGDMYLTLGSIKKEWEVTVRGIDMDPHINILTADQTFKAKAYPAGTYTYQWLLDGKLVGTRQTYTFIHSRDMVGSHTLTVNAAGGGNTFSYTRTIVVPFAKLPEGDYLDLSHIVKTSDGGYIASGGVTTDINHVVTYEWDAIHSWDSYVMKFNAQGEIAWKLIFGGDKDESVQCLAATNDGGCMVAGPSTSHDIPGAPLSGGTDVYLARIGSNGDLQWQKLYGSSGNEGVKSLRETDAGGYILCGSYGATYTPFVYSQGWVLELDSQGNPLHEQLYGGNRHDYVYAAAPGPDGGYAIAGETYSTDIPGIPSDAWSRGYGFVFDVDAQGTVIDRKFFEIDRSTDSNRLSSLTPTSDGGLIAIGLLPYNGSWCNKLDAETSVLWEYEPDSPLNIHGVLPITSGGYLLYGRSIDPLIGSYVAQLDEEGNELFFVSRIGPMLDFSYIFDVTAAGDDRYMALDYDYLLLLDLGKN